MKNLRTLAFSLFGAALSGACGNIQGYYQIRNTEIRDLATIQAATPGARSELPEGCAGSVVRLYEGNQSITEGREINYEPSAFIVRISRINLENGAIANRITLIQAFHNIKLVTDPSRGLDNTIDNMVIKTFIKNSEWPNGVETNTPVEDIHITQAHNEKGLVDIAILTVIDRAAQLPYFVKPAGKISEWTGNPSAVFVAGIPTEAGIQEVLVREIDIKTLTKSEVFPEEYPNIFYIQAKLKDESIPLGGGDSSGQVCEVNPENPNGTVSGVATTIALNRLDVIYFMGIPAGFDQQIDENINGIN